MACIQFERSGYHRSWFLSICPNPVRAIHISNAQTGGSNNVSDLSIVGIGNDAPSGTYTIWDDITGAQLADASVAIYALGEAINVGISSAGM